MLKRVDHRQLVVLFCFNEKQLAIVLLLGILVSISQGLVNKHHCYFGIMKCNTGYVINPPLFSVHNGSVWTRKKINSCLLQIAYLLLLLKLGRRYWLNVVLPITTYSLFSLVKNIKILISMFIFDIILCRDLSFNMLNGEIADRIQPGRLRYLYISYTEFQLSTLYF